MVAEQEMHSRGKLTLQGRDQIEQLVRFVAARGIAMGAVNDFLQHEMAARLTAKVRFRQEGAKVLQVAVQVACGQHFGGIRKHDEAAAPARPVAEGANGALKGLQQTVGVWHDVSFSQHSERERDGSRDGTATMT